MSGSTSSKASSRSSGTHAHALSLSRGSALRASAFAKESKESGTGKRMLSMFECRASRIHAELGDACIEELSNRRSYLALKRVFDVAFSLSVVVLFGWLFAGIGLAIKLDDPKGRVLFRQTRVGKNGKPFEMYKFRTMVVDAEERLSELQAFNEKDGPVFKMSNDPRVTRVGSLIRKASLDEFPQFFNVIIGNMSVVGPRPALPKEVDEYSDYHRRRLLVKPGITCYWQTRRNRDTIGFDEWVDLDLLYIKNSSLWTDFKLIVQTVGVVLTAQGS